jgi:hypothetical protein
MHEQRVIRTRTDDADLETILCIPSGEAIETVKALTRVEVVLRPLAIDIKGTRIQRDVHCAPPNVILRGGILDDALVLRRAAGLQAGVGDERAILRDTCVFLIADRMFVKLAG